MRDSYRPQSEPHCALDGSQPLDTKPTKETGKFNLAKFPNRRNETDGQLALSLNISNHLGLFKKTEHYRHNGTPIT